MEYFVLKGHDTTGPFSEEDLRRAFAGQRLDATDLVRPDDERHYTPLRKLLDRLDAADAPAPAPRNSNVVGTAGWVPVPASKNPTAVLLALVGTNPLQAGLVGVAFAALLAFLSRWPLLVALPGLMLGVIAGLLLILRHRPVAGGIISLAAILFPIALAPRANVATPAVHESAVSSVPPPTTSVELPKPGPVAAVETPRRPVETPTPPAAATKGTADLLVETPRPVEQPAPTVPAPPALPSVVDKTTSAVPGLPPLPPVVEKPAGESPAAEIPPSAKSDLPGKIMAAISSLFPSHESSPTPAPLPPLPTLPEPLPPLPNVAPRPTGTALARPEDLVFLVDTGTARGTGFLATDQGRVYFFTNLHVISGAKKINARSTLTTLDFKDGNVEVAADRDLVRFAVPAQPALQFGDLPKVDDAVVALGNSGGREVVTRLEGKVLGVGPAQIEVSSEFIPGNSGGPLLDQNNRVLGVATYVLRGENVPDWIKAGTRFSTTRRFGVRVTDDVKWESMPLGTLVRQTVLLQTGEDLLTEYIAAINALAKKPFQEPISTKFPERTELRLYVDDYNRACRESSGHPRNSHSNNADYVARLRDQVGKLSRGMRSTEQSFRRELGTVSKGYAKERETDLLKAFDELATAIEKNEQDLFHM